MKVLVELLIVHLLHDVLPKAAVDLLQLLLYHSRVLVDPS